MLLQPRYGDRPALSVALPPAGGTHPMVRQRRRLQALLPGMSDAQWHHPSRCAGWSAQAVITHLTSTNQFWDISIQRGLMGEPTQFLATFDPVASPAQMVTDRAQDTPRDTLDAFVTSNEALLATVEALAESQMELLAEAPPGHLAVRHVLDHALWDAWVHERDILLPQGAVPVEDPDEIRTSLRYAAALGRAISVAAGTVEGSAEVVATNPDDHLVVTVEGDQVVVHDGPPPPAARRLDGPAVELLEMLSMRDIGRARPATVDWLSAGLALVFDQTADA